MICVVLTQERNKMGVNYALAFIYQLTCNVTGKFYIGSSAVTENKRLYMHRGHYKEWLAGARGYNTSFEVMEMGDYRFEVLEHYACANDLELRKREQVFLDANPTSVNKYRTFCTPEQKSERRRRERAQPWKCLVCDLDMTNGAKWNHEKTQKHLEAVERSQMAMEDRNVG
jgi:ribosomal protein L37AE/L43A